MNIRDFRKEYVEEAKAIALANYEDERKYVNELPAVSELPGLEELAENGLGVAAFERGAMVGFLCCCGPFENAFRATDVKGCFAPMGAHGAIGTERPKVYAAMYQAAAAKWVKAGAVSHAICLYAHDEEIQKQFFNYGFGLRCLDAIRPMELINCEPCKDYDFAELSKDESELVYPLDLALDQHQRESPFFMNRESDSLEEFVASAMQNESRYFVARQQDKVCAFLKISALGETCVAIGSSYRHIKGAYCLLEHRGKGLYQNLLNFAISALKKEGYTNLGVDFESFNPNGRGFWLKYFDAYTHSVVRRIDERILRTGEYL